MYLLSFGLSVSNFSSVKMYYLYKDKNHFIFIQPIRIAQRTQNYITFCNVNVILHLHLVGGWGFRKM